MFNTVFVFRRDGTECLPFLRVLLPEGPSDIPMTWALYGRARYWNPQDRRRFILAQPERYPEAPFPAPGEAQLPTPWAYHYNSLMEHLGCSYEEAVLTIANDVDGIYAPGS